MKKYEIETTEKGLEIKEDREYYYLTSDNDGVEVLYPKDGFTLQESIIDMLFEECGFGDYCREFGLKRIKK